MSTDVKPLNTIPLQQYIDKVKVADSTNQQEVRMTLVEAKNLAFTLAGVMSRLHGDLEKLVDKQNNTEEVVSVTVDGGKSWQHNPINYVYYSFTEINISIRKLI